MSKSNNKKDIIFGKDLSDNRSKDYNTIDFDYVYRPDILNIFSDASMDVQNNRGCYGVVAVTRDTIVDQAFFTRAYTTNNECEALGIRLALYIASGQLGRFKRINIFSDSLININSIKKYSIYEARPVRNDNGDIIRYDTYNSSNGNSLANQNILNECFYIYRELINKSDIVDFNLIYQPGHVFDYIKSNAAIQNFRVKYSDNNSFTIPSESYLIYISRFNDYVDHVTRSSLWEMAHRERKDRVYYKTPIHFIPIGTPKSFYREEIK